MWSVWWLDNVVAKVIMAWNQNAFNFLSLESESNIPFGKKNHGPNLLILYVEPFHETNKDGSRYLGLFAHFFMQLLGWKGSTSIKYGSFLTFRECWKQEVGFPLHPWNSKDTSLYWQKSAYLYGQISFIPWPILWFVGNPLGTSFVFTPSNMTFQTKASSCRQCCSTEQ